MEANPEAAPTNGAAPPPAASDADPAVAIRAELEPAIRAEMEPLLREKFAAERIAARPEKPEDYQLTAPDFEVPDGLELKLDGLVDDPLVSWWRKTAFELGLGQDQFQAGISAAAQAEIDAFVGRKAEMERLGENGPQRLDRVRTWLEAHLGEAAPKLMGAIDSVGVVEAFEKMLDAVKPVDSATAPTAKKSTAELRVMMEDPRYRSDPEYRELVTAEYRRTVGTAPYRGTYGQMQA